MRGRKMSFKEKNNAVQEFIGRVKPYEKPPKLNFDLRGYAKYLSENNIPGNKVPQNVINMFKK